MSDLGKHIAVQKDICIKFGDAKKLSKSDELQVLLSDLDSITVANPEKVDSLTRRWTLDSEILLFPGDIVTFRVPIRKRRTLKTFLAKSLKREGLQEYQLAYEVVVKEFSKLNRSDASTIAAFAEGDVVLTLELLEGSIERIIEMASERDLDPLLPERVQRVIDSSDTFWSNAQSLQGVLENLPVAENAYQVLENAISTLGNVHPLAKAILTALAIPYKMLRNEVEFKQKIKDMAETMRVACRCLMETRYHTKITFAKDVFKSILRLLRNAAVFIDIYCRKGRIQQVIGAQFSNKLDAFSKDLIKQKNDFQTAMILQISRDADSTAAMTAEEYLQRRLCPVKQDPLGDGCLAETRKTVLDRVRAWIDNADSEKRILWIVGAPGAGKTTVATSIIKDLGSRTYAKFFAKRDKPDLCDARRIWPSMTFSLADKRNGMKAALMLALENTKNTDVQDFSVCLQFESFFKGPLETDLKEAGSRSREIPVIIIDALDECYSKNSSNWDSLLESLAGWPNNSKLIITSRYHYELPDRPSDTYNFIDLVTGLNAPEENKNDIKVFFTTKFTQMRLTKAFRDFDLPKEWPRRQEIEEMTAYALGLFIWADMAVKYIEARDGAGNDPVERLQNVLDDIRDEGQSRIKGENRVDNLYARIIFEAFPRLIRDERERARRVLATVLLAKEPLRKEDLIELMSLQISRNTVMSTLSKLKAIIPSSDDKLRVCHKSVSDFGLSRERSWAALLRLVPDDEDCHSYVIDVEKENKDLALACLHLMHCKLSTSNITEQPTSSQKHPNGFPYARHHWFEHVEEAGDAYRHIISNLRCLAGAMEVAYHSLERFAADLDSEKDKGMALVGSICSAIELAIQCVDSIDHEHKEFEVSRKKLGKYTLNLGVVRGEFQIAMVLRNQAFTTDKSSTDGFPLRQLAPSIEADLDDGCAPGTRTAILSEAKEWLENTDPDAPKILWIVGAPGAGKSAVSASLVKKEFPGIHLCTKFFAKRDFADRRDPSLVWRTLIYDIARQHIGMRGSIMEALLGNSLLGSSDQSEHRDLLFKAISDQQCLPVVAVADALDECFKEDNEEWGALLHTVSGSAEFPQGFKLVVTSRDFPNIRSALSEVSHQICLPTGTDVSADSKSDMEVFFRLKLAGLPRASYWLSGDILPQLVDRAAGSFIWAKMFAGLVELNVHGRLEDIDIATGDTPGSTENVDVLYAKVLVETLGQLPEKEREDSRVLLSTLVLAEDPLHRDTLESLPFNGPYKNQAHQSAKTILDGLSSIITVDKNLRVRIPHKSFSDFYLSQSRCQKAMEQLNLPTKEQHTYLMHEQDDQGNLAIACLQWMCNTLTFNTYGISSSHVLNSKIPQLEDEDHTLVYACRYWGEHLKHATRDDSFRAQAQPLLHIFFHQKVLFWLEILSLAKAVSSAKKSLGAAREFLEGYDNDLAVFADDVLKFVTDFEYPIAMAAPHVYISALPISPSNSRIFQVYVPQVPNLFSVTSGRREDWGDAPVTGDGHDDEVWSVSFFQDGFRLASGSQDGTVRIWDSETGKAISPPFQHDSPVCSMAVSPDGKLIASGSRDCALSIWDSETGARKLNLTDAHNDVIRSVAFSPDGSRIVTGSSDNTVKVWDTASGELCLAPLMGHTDWVNSVAFSPDGTLIASGSEDDTIRIWDATTGKSHVEPLVGHTSFVLCLAFTADGHYLASGSHDYTIRLWNVFDGFTQTSFINSGSPVYSISFSPKSEILASGHEDGSLHFWDLRDGELHQSCNPIHGHTGTVMSIAFSPDGQILASASGPRDNSIKFWTVPMSITPKANYVRDVSSRKPQYKASDLDQHGNQVLSDDCYIDRAGWLWDSHGEDAKVLFWVPKENRGGFWFPRNTAVIHKTVTKIDFSRFVHGEKWAECIEPVDSDK